MTVEWPVTLDGVTESVVATLGPNGLWNLAALGLFDTEPVTARTWGGTRTRRNFEERGEGYVQFTRDPVDFVEAACTIREAETPILDSASAWARVSVEATETGETDGTEWVEWTLRPTDAAVERCVVPTTNRGYNAVIEATVAASRIGVQGYDDATLHERIDYFETVAKRCGGDRERTAFERLRASMR